MKIEMVITRSDGTVVTADFTERGYGIGGEKYSYYDLLVKICTNQELDDRDKEELEYIHYRFKKETKKNEDKAD